MIGSGQLARAPLSLAHLRSNHHCRKPLVCVQNASKWRRRRRQAFLKSKITNETPANRDTGPHTWDPDSRNIIIMHSRAASGHSCDLANNFPLRFISPSWLLDHNSILLNSRPIIQVSSRRAALKEKARRRESDIYTQIVFLFFVIR